MVFGWGFIISFADYGKRKKGISKCLIGSSGAYYLIMGDKTLGNREWNLII